MRYLDMRERPKRYQLFIRCEEGWYHILAADSVAEAEERFKRTEWIDVLEAKIVEYGSAEFARLIKDETSENRRVR